MAIYRTSRDIEASVIDFITDEMTSVWNNVAVVKSFQQVSTQALPAICIRVGNLSFKKAEIGSSSLIRTADVFLDIFCTSDGQRLDLTDWVIESIKDGCPYYEFTTTKSGRTTIVTGQTQNGRILVTNIDVTDVDFNLDKSSIDPRDRYRSLIVLTISLGRVE